jgi:acyl carrier protein
MLDKLKEVFSDVLGADPSEVTMDTNIDSLLEWDSLRHLELVTNIETKFEVKFKMNEIINLNSISSIISTIEAKAKS